MGHTVAYCYFRFDNNYIGTPPDQSKNNQQSNYNQHSAYITSLEMVCDSAWYADSGASSHVIGDSNNLTQKSDFHGKDTLMVGNGQKLSIAHTGFAQLPIRNRKNLLLNNILHDPDIEKNLISISQLTSHNNVFIEFNSLGCLVKDKLMGVVLLKGKLKDSLYHLDLPATINQSPVEVTNSFPSSTSSLAFLCNVEFLKSKNIEYVNPNSLVSSKETWHRSLSHPSSKVLSQVLNNCNEKIKLNSDFTFCDAYQYGKSHLLPYQVSNSHASNILDLVHTDLWGLAPIQSTSGYRYYMHFLNDHNRFTLIFPLKLKSEVFGVFLQFKTLVENQFERKIKCLQSDMGGEYMSFSEFVKNHGVEFRHLCPHTLAQNGRAERKHRHITEIGLTLLAQAHMPVKFWWEIFQTTTYLINRLPTPILNLSLGSQAVKTRKSFNKLKIEHQALPLAPRQSTKVKAAPPLTAL
ncbi:hypothetical protein EZV62_021528 [Acer yangbiense]|uniref:Integrase catalytic domain-containing protein n=1 Tax=Acer yangbiense TaxID=1000413 RepID=A0A5C7H6K5_9ROSI|nr:hypothetical protein EZV62_021528 [Acer yangbiense]